MRDVCLPLLASVLIGCGAEIDDATSSPIPGKSDDGTGSGSGSDANLTAKRFLDRIGKDQCDRAFDCRASFPQGDPGFVRAWGATPGTCYSMADAFYRPSIVDAQIKLGTIAFDVAAAEDCLEGTTYRATCSEFFSRGPSFDDACDAALVGTADTGDACITLFDCGDPGSSCDLDAGICVP